MVLQETLISGFPPSSITEAQRPSLVPNISPSASKAAMITSGPVSLPCLKVLALSQLWSPFAT